MVVVVVVVVVVDVTAAMLLLMLPCLQELRFFSKLLESEGMTDRWADGWGLL